MVKLLPTNALYEQIIQYKKKDLDIAALIENINIKGMDLSDAIISYLDVSDQDIQETNFANSIIGTKDNVVNFNRAIINGCCFAGTTFPGIVWLRRAYARNCNFKRMFAPYVDYRYTDFRGSSFCYCTWTIGTDKGLGAYFDDNFFRELSFYWGTKVISNELYNNLLEIKQKYEEIIKNKN